jgi:YggT family protein
MQDGQETVETTTPTTRVNGVPRTSTEVRTVDAGVGAVDRAESVAYDPYANKRLAAYRVIQLVYLVFGLIEALIAIRFVLKALGANPSAGFAQFIYGITNPLVAPFYGLFGNPASQGSVLEVHSIVALIVYALLAWLIVRLTWILVGESRSAVKTHSTTIDTRL